MSIHICFSELQGANFGCTFFFSFGTLIIEKEMSGEAEGSLDYTENSVDTTVDESLDTRTISDNTAEDSDSNDSDVNYSYELESGFDEAQGRRETMEDTHVVVNNALEYEEYGLREAYEGKKVAFYGVFDGHGGVSNQCLNAIS